MTPDVEPVEVRYERRTWRLEGVPPGLTSEMLAGAAQRVRERMDEEFNRWCVGLLDLVDVSSRAWPEERCTCPGGGGGTVRRKDCPRNGAEAGGGVRGSSPGAIAPAGLLKGGAGG